jgi:hypothetical protein
MVSSPVASKSSARLKLLPALKRCPALSTRTKQTLHRMVFFVDHENQLYSCTLPWWHFGLSRISHSNVNKILHSSSYFHLGGTKAASMDDDEMAMDATLTGNEFCSVQVVVDDDDDDDDELVRMVIDENPPQEQGIRPEWGDRVGWNRKEDTYNIDHDNEGPAD